MLAFATASKLYPGLLIVYLLVRRQWRALAWTAGWGAVLTLATLADVGWLQIRAFFEHLPGLLSGEAFPAFRNPAAMAMNFSVPGIGFKLKVLGIGDLSFRHGQGAGLDLHDRGRVGHGGAGAARARTQRGAARVAGDHRPSPRCAARSCPRRTPRFRSSGCCRCSPPPTRPRRERWP